MGKDGQSLWQDWKNSITAQYADQVKALGPLREGKRLLNLSGTRPLAEQLHDERVTMGSLIGSPNQIEAVKAYFEKREPVFED